MTTRKLIQHSAQRSTTLVLLTFLGCCLLQGKAIACTLSDSKPTHPGQPQKVAPNHTGNNSSPIDLDYYQSSDNPFHAD